MSRFTYRIRDGNGAIGSGVLNASSLIEASSMLRSEGNVIVDLREQSAGRTDSDVSVGITVSSKTRIKHRELVFFVNQLAVMIDTGVPLPEALDCIAAQAGSEEFRLVIRDVAEHVKGGVELSAALGRYPKIFGRLFVAMMKAAEASGKMGMMLQRVSQYIERQHQIRRKVKGAATYPLAMLGFCVLVVIGMLIFILPRFEKIYGRKAAALPVPTQMLLATSDAIIVYWPYIIGVLVVVAVGLIIYLRGQAGRIAADNLRIKAPVIGNMFRQTILARSIRTFATMISSGVSVLDALEITAEVSGNVFYRRIWLDLKSRVTEGAGLADEMDRHSLIPRSIVQMVAAGERSGRLGVVLDRVAGFCEEELQTTIKTATNFIEPVMIVIMGAIVGGVALALLLPVFSISKVIAG